MAGPRRKDRKTVRDLLPKDVFVLPLKNTTKEGAIRELLNALVIHGVLDLSREESTLEAILGREKVATTAIGHAIAMPHAKSKFAESFGVAVGLRPDGIDFGARDGEDVKVVFLWVCPPASTGEHLALMRALATVAQDPDNADKLASCRDKRALLRALEEFEVEPRK